MHDNFNIVAFEASPLKPHAAYRKPHAKIQLSFTVALTKADPFNFFPHLLSCDFCLLSLLLTPYSSNVTPHTDPFPIHTFPFSPIPPLTHS